MRASSSSSRVASRGELLARRLGVAAPGPRRDLTPGRDVLGRPVYIERTSTSPREWSIVPRGVPTVGFAASAIVASRGREERTARRSARGFAAVPSATPPDAPPRNRDRDEDRGKATLALDPETAPRPAPWSYGDIATIPNALSIARGASGPLIAAGIVNDAPPELILAGIVAAGASDWLDGYLARRWNQTGVAGSYLDPAGDKAFVASVAVALAWKGAIPAWLAACFLGRDAALVAGVSYQRARGLGWRWETWGEFFGMSAGKASRGGEGEGSPLSELESSPSPPPPPALPAMEPQVMGKWSTAVQFALFGCAAATRTAWGSAAISPEAMTALHYVAGGTTAASAATYYFLSSDKFRRRRERMEARVGARVAQGKARMRAVKELGRHLKERGRADVEQRIHRAGESMARMEARVGEMMDRRSSRSTAPE